VSGDWSHIEKGGEVTLMRREDAAASGWDGLTEEMLLLISIEGEEHSLPMQCSRARLPELLRSLAPKKIHLYKPDSEMEAVARVSAGAILH
jgi:hypothetical protein